MNAKLMTLCAIALLFTGCGKRPEPPDGNAGAASATTAAKKGEAVPTDDKVASLSPLQREQLMNSICRMLINNQKQLATEAEMLRWKQEDFLVGNEALGDVYDEMAAKTKDMDRAICDKWGADYPRLKRLSPSKSDALSRFAYACEKATEKRDEAAVAKFREDALGLSDAERRTLLKKRAAQTHEENMAEVDRLGVDFLHAK